MPIVSTDRPRFFFYFELRPYDIDVVIDLLIVSSPYIPAANSNEVSRQHDVRSF